MSEFEMGSGGLPAGSYAVEFVGGESYDEKEPDQFGKTAKYRLKWKVLGGDLAGTEAVRIANRTFTPKSVLGKFAVGFKGGPIKSGEGFSFADYVGARGSLLVVPTENGTKIELFLPEQAKA